MKEKIVRLTKRVFFLLPVAILMLASPSFVFLIVVLTVNIPVLNNIVYILSAAKVINMSTALVS